MHKWSWTYTYDNRNELTSTMEFDASSVKQLEVDYKYDVYGNLIESDTSVGGASPTVATRSTSTWAASTWLAAPAPPTGP